MKCSRMDDSRLIDYSAVAAFDGAKGLQNQIVRRVGKRKDGMTLAELGRWFAATPYDFIAKAVKNCVNTGSVSLDRVRVRRVFSVDKDIKFLRYQLPLVLQEAESDLHEYRREGSDCQYTVGYISAIRDVIAVIDIGKPVDGYWYRAMRRLK